MEASMARRVTSGPLEWCPTNCSRALCLLVTWATGTGRRFLGCSRMWCWASNRFARFHALGFFQSEQGLARRLAPAKTKQNKNKTQGNGPRVVERRSPSEVMPRIMQEASVSCSRSRSSIVTWSLFGSWCLRTLGWMGKEGMAWQRWCRNHYKKDMLVWCLERRIYIKMKF